FRGKVMDSSAIIAYIDNSPLFQLLTKTIMEGPGMVVKGIAAAASAVGNGGGNMARKAHDGIGGFGGSLRSYVGEAAGHGEAAEKGNTSISIVKSQQLSAGATERQSSLSISPQFAKANQLNAGMFNMVDAAPHDLGGLAAPTFGNAKAPVRASGIAMG